MYCIIYRFHIKPGRVDDLEQSWRDITEAYLRSAGSLGSRLHATETPGVFVAYAQWPDAETHQRAQLPADLAPSQALMKDACEKIETLHQLELRIDLLAPPG